MTLLLSPLRIFADKMTWIKLTWIKLLFDFLDQIVIWIKMQNDLDQIANWVSETWQLRLNITK